MACQFHQCISCGKQWCDNEHQPECPQCGGIDIHTDYDE